MIYHCNISIKCLLISAVIFLITFGGSNICHAQHTDNIINKHINNSENPWGNNYTSIAKHIQITVDLYRNNNVTKIITKEFDNTNNHKYNNNKEVQNSKQNYYPFIQTWQIISGFIIAIIVIFLIIYISYKRHQKLLLENHKIQKLLSLKNNEIKKKNTELEIINTETKDTKEQIKNIQNQLIESQRLSSLGQVTAGIAHEIRNPLNFVTNFSTLIVELLEDLNEIIKNDIQLPNNKETEEAKEILTLINSNAEKIHRHGERASTIITNMLDVSRKSISNGYTKEDFNTVIKDSTKLAFEGAKGNMPGFDVNLKFDFDENIKDVPILKHDISRVFINMITNSCQAIEPKLEEDIDFFGKINISTKLIKDKVRIIITDNGIGISNKVKDNIFTPFFTTKKSGKGTGLGLTMTNDIITKQHKGTITVDSKEGEFTTFTIEIPTNLKS